MKYVVTVVCFWGKLVPMKRLIVLFLTKGSEKVRNISVGVNYFEDFVF